MPVDRPAGMRPLALHAAPPAGHWINDPNGLVHCGGAWRLFAQHRTDGPDFRATGWARFSSPDLLGWTFDGMVIPDGPDGWAYSGCVEQQGARLYAIHTHHRGGIEVQVARTSDDHGKSWSPAVVVPSLGIPAANRRDPYIFRANGTRHLLLAEPCDWHAAADSPPSRIALYRESGAGWAALATIEPALPPGILAEVPVMAMMDGHAVLFASLVDRRGGGARSTVHAWVGRFDGDSFVAALAPDGARVDLGFDFYALTLATAVTPPLAVAWAGSWDSARDTFWGGFAGGPITVPRSLSVANRRGIPRLEQRLPAAVAARFSSAVDAVPVAGLGRIAVAADARVELTIGADDQQLAVVVDPAAGRIALTRSGNPRLARSARHDVVLSARGMRTVQLLIDGPLIELFLPDEGLAATVALAPAGAPLSVALVVAGVARCFSWHVAS